MRKLFLYYKSLPRLMALYLKDKVILSKPAAVLLYHSVDSNPEFFTVTLENFSWQMNYLYKNNYRVISLNELVEDLRSDGDIPDKTVVLTFDDGYEDNYLNVFPVLKKYNFPATIFLITGRIGDKNYTNKRKIKLPMLDWREIEEMHKSGLIDFEPHTVNHPKLSRLSRLEVIHEIMESKRIIEEKLEKKCDFFAFPYGDYNNETLDAAAAAGAFRAFFNVSKGFVSRDKSGLLLKRNSVDSLTDKIRFKLVI